MSEIKKILEEFEIQLFEDINTTFEVEDFGAQSTYNGVTKDLEILMLRLGVELKDERLIEEFTQPKTIEEIVLELEEEFCFEEYKELELF